MLTYTYTSYSNYTIMNTVYIPKVSIPTDGIDVVQMVGRHYFLLGDTINDGQRTGDIHIYMYKKS